MLKINSNPLAEEPWSSPNGKFAGASKSVSEALGRKPQSTELNERHPFDVEILRIPAGKVLRYTMVHYAPQSAQKPQVVPKAAAH